LTDSSRFLHRAVQGASVTTLSAARRPEVGPVAVLPEEDVEPMFLAAVADGGGSVGPLGADTRAIVWLGPAKPDGLLAALESAPRVQWVQLPWAGVDQFAQALADHDREDLIWTSAKGAYAQPVAEHALALALAGMRHFPERARASSWGEKKGESLYGRHVVIVGAGGIAIELIRLLQPFDARVTVVRRTADPVEGADRTVTSDRLDEVLPDADVIVLAAASTAETRHLIGERQLGMLKPTAVLVNIARGPLIDTEALVVALREKKLLFAGLDVTDPEERCLITPHSADTPEMTAPLLAVRVRLNVEAFTSSGRFVGVVDPEAGY
jgi:phosphoglycerate dehydrogenase-like enzyme